MLEARHAARKLRDLGLPKQAQAFEDVAKTPGMPLSIGLEQARKWVDNTKGSRVYEDSPLIWARLGLKAYDFANGSSDVPIIKGGSYDNIDPKALKDFMADGMVLSICTEHGDLDDRSLPPTILTLIVQTLGRPNERVREEMRSGVERGKPSHYAVSIDIDPTGRGFGNVEYRDTHIDKDSRRRVLRSRYIRTDVLDERCQDSQKLADALLDSVLASLPASSQALL